MHHDSQFRSEAEWTGTNTCYKVDELWKPYTLVTKPTCYTIPLLPLFFERISLVRCLLPLLYHPIPPGEGSSKAEFWLQMSKFIKHGASKKKQDKYPVTDRDHYQTGSLHIHQKWLGKSKTVELEAISWQNRAVSPRMGFLPFSLPQAFLYSVINSSGLPEKRLSLWLYSRVQCF